MNFDKFYLQDNNLTNFNEYQTKSRVTAKYPAIGHAIIYPMLGLVNEAGEVAGKVKKVFRDLRSSVVVPHEAQIFTAGDFSGCVLLFICLGKEKSN